MGLSAAERQRRSRAHKRGDHSLCEVGRCSDVTPDVTPVTPAPVTPVVTEPDLGERGRRLYREVLEEHPKLGPRQRVVLEETARTADRCERLDRILRGDLVEWARIETADGGRYHVVVDRTLAEARQQQAALARLLSELRQSLAPPAKESAPARPEKESGGGKVVDLASRLAQLRSTPTG